MEKVEWKMNEMYISLDIDILYSELENQQVAPPT